MAFADDESCSCIVLTCCTNSKQRKKRHDKLILGEYSNEKFLSKCGDKFWNYFQDKEESDEESETTEEYVEANKFQEEGQPSEDDSVEANKSIEEGESSEDDDSVEANNSQEKGQTSEDDGVEANSTHENEKEPEGDNGPSRNHEEADIDLNSSHSIMHHPTENHNHEEVNEFNNVSLGDEVKQ